MHHAINSGILSQDGPVNLSGYDDLVWFWGIHVLIFLQPLDLPFLFPTIGPILFIVSVANIVVSMGIDCGRLVNGPD